MCHFSVLLRLFACFQGSNKCRVIHRRDSVGLVWEIETGPGVVHECEIESSKLASLLFTVVDLDF